MERAVATSLKVDPSELCGGKDQVVISDAVLKPDFDEIDKLEADYNEFKQAVPKAAPTPPQMTKKPKPPITTCENCGWKSGGLFGPDQHAFGCPMYLTINQPSQAAKPMPVLIRKTQKARGIEKLNNFAMRLGVNTLPHLFVSNEQVKLISKWDLLEEDAKTIWKEALVYGQNKKGEKLIFARPCPLTPRHGFTDSRLVPVETTHTTFMERLAPLCAQMLKDDPEAELILMRPCFAHFNIVTNEKAIVVGKGHDGATGGKETFTFPVSKAFAFGWSEKAEIGVSQESGVFSEYVGRVQKGKRYGEGDYDAAGADAVGGIRITQTYLTQLRGGPKIDITGDYVPREICLDRKYLIPYKNPETGEEYKDTEWEKVINDVKAKKDWERYFVYHPGGAISSHFGVHCYINGIPYITSSIRLNKRSVLKGNAKNIKADLDAFKRGFRKGPNLLHLITPAEGVKILLACLHNFPAMDASDPKQAEVLGFAVEFAIHLGLSTCLGESRYAKRERMDWIKTGAHGTREFVYYRAQLFDLNYVLRKAHLRCPWFGIPNWGGGSGVGGLKWLECSEAVFALWNAVCILIANENPTLASYQLGCVISQLNKVVNICHNAAKMLTKFTGNMVFDAAASRPQHVAFKVAPILFELLKADVNEKSIQFEHFDLPKEKWDADLIRDKRAERVKVAIKDLETKYTEQSYQPKAPIQPAKGYDQCPICGWYTTKEAPFGHYSSCPAKDSSGLCTECCYTQCSDPKCQACHASTCSQHLQNLKTAASAAPSSYETDANESNFVSKCDDESCSSCHPNK